MSIVSLRNESLNYFLDKKIDRILFRVKTIQDTYYRIHNLNLKIRLIKEHAKLKRNFNEIKSLISLLEKSSADKFSLSKLLVEKYVRYEKEIFKNSSLFSA